MNEPYLKTIENFLKVKEVYRTNLLTDLIKSHVGNDRSKLDTLIKRTLDIGHTIDQSQRRKISDLEFAMMSALSLAQSETVSEEIKNQSANFIVSAMENSYKDGKITHHYNVDNFKKFIEKRKKREAGR